MSDFWFIIFFISGVIVGWILSDWINKSFIDDYTMSPWQLLSRKIGSSIMGGLVALLIPIFIVLSDKPNEQSASDNSAADYKQKEQNASDSSAAADDKPNEQSASENSSATDDKPKDY